MNHSRGYTLVELIVAIGIFALVMVLAAGSYLIMIGLNRQAQATASGIDNLSFAIESLVRNIRTGSAYACGVGDCPSGGSSFTFKDAGGHTVVYSFTGGTITESVDGSVATNLTEPSVTIDSSKSKFYVTGTDSFSKNGDVTQPRVVIIVSATISAGVGKVASSSMQAEVTMRGPDI